MIKSPFFVVSDFISPKLADHITETVRFPESVLSLKDITYQDDCSLIISERVKHISDSICNYYNVEISEFSDIEFVRYVEGWKDDRITCDNSVISGKKWHRTHPNRDFSCILFISEHCTTVIEKSNEVYGGSYELLTHNFSFTPHAGTLVVHPSGPNFVNRFNTVKVGNLIVARFYFKTKNPYVYNRKDFPGDYKKWFNKNR